jgi:hypothetical protein
LGDYGTFFLWSNFLIVRFDNLDFVITSKKVSFDVIYNP